MSTQPFIGEIKLFGGNFQINGYAYCAGQLISIADNSALFALIGTTYGGDGQVTFGLPDLRGRVPINQGQGPGLSPKNLGEASGQETVTLLSTQMPAHNHLLSANSATANTANPSGNFWAAQPALLQYESTSTASNMKPTALSVAGGNQPHTNIQPFLAINYQIALQGIFPSRN